ncbi:MAG: cardiolipin synthase [Bacteroidales bacterium]|jgi:cardiolipin synthase|nr:cardiolipin synthase [Bacteroidales bacterium]MDD2571025.1 cardiolipin synthase [Bacteroidales bacterium]MDD2813164.1 cardiolipin synthase [Bacteroidales bacterium]MDD3812167.1 cardiolipin synthase [Bacteroidales bacterium]MDD3871778.1 cardiolipin synthase [Bacteroidales bacterium]
MLSSIFSTLGERGGFWLLLDVILLITIVVMIIVIVLENHDPIKTIAWILILFLVPIGGVILYIYLGVNPRKRKIISMKEIADRMSLDRLLRDQMIRLNQKLFIRDERLTPKRHLMKLLLNNSKALITERNRIRILNNGRQTFGSIIYELERATNHIHFEFYIIEDDQIGNRIKDILVRKARAGVKVKVLYDDLGSWSLSRRYIRELTSAGAEVCSFLPVRTYVFANKLNYRLHRKIIVVDGQVGFVGGLNIADRYLRGLGPKNHWRDIHLRLEGESVRSLQAIFLLDWNFANHSSDYDQSYFPESRITNECLVQIVASGPDSDWQSIMQAYFSAIATAERYVYISTPYFLPNESIMTALKTAALSGVEVRLLLPEKNDSWIVGRSSRSYLTELLECGTHIHLYHRGFTHSKLMIVDDIFASVGTANMDIRSFNQDFEVNALIYDQKLSQQLRLDFMDDLEYSREMSLAEWKSRPWYHKLQESIARIFSPLL